VLFKLGLVNFLAILLLVTVYCSSVLY